MSKRIPLVGLLLASTALWAHTSSAQEANKPTPVLLDTITLRAIEDGAAIEGYRADIISSATRTATPLKQTPQSVQVITPDILQDQAPVSMAEALINVSGAQGNVPLQTPAFESTIMRGFPAQFYRDGISNYINTGDANAMANIERIEVLKGPNAILYGGGVGAPLGGVINIISKKPESSDFETLGLTFGTHGLLEPSFDINRRLSNSVMFRVSGSISRADADVDVIETERYSLSPSLILGYGTDTRLTVEGYLSHWEAQEYQGLPAFGTVAGDFRLDRSLFLGDPNIPKSHTETRKLTLTLDHDFSNNWSNRTQLRYGKNEVEQITQITLSASPDTGPAEWSLFNSYVPGKQTEYSLNTSFQGQFDTGTWEHTLLFGADWSRIDDYSLMYMDYAGSNDLLNPRPWPIWTMPSTLAMGEGDGRYTTAGAYAQLQSTLGRLHLLGGLRLAYLKTDYDSEGYGRRDTLDDTRLLPRIGAVYDLTDQLSAFASYSQGMSANAFYFYSSMPKPEYSKQAEFGVKYDDGALSGSIAAFRIERKNVPVTDPNDPTYLTSVTEGQQRSKGIEIDGVWQSEGSWRIMANYAYTDAELTADIPNGAPAGSDLPGVPRHSGSLWVDYDRRDVAGNGWRAGVGGHAASSSWINQSNAYKTAGYGVVNASGSYTAGPMTVSLAVKNLLNRDYDLPFWKMMEGRVSPAAERQFLLNISRSF